MLAFHHSLKEHLMITHTSLPLAETININVSLAINNAGDGLRTKQRYITIQHIAERSNQQTFLSENNQTVIIIKYTAAPLQSDRAT